MAAQTFIRWARLARPSYVHVNRVEPSQRGLKEWRAVATGYGKTACSFMSVLRIAAAFDWIKRSRGRVMP